MVTLLIIGYLITVILSYGIVIGSMKATYLQHYDDQLSIWDRLIALLISLAGPISLILFYIVTNGARFGLRFW